MCSDQRPRLLYAAAFGPDPVAALEEAGGVLPSARTERETWWRAVAHGGFGHYARAAADLGVLRRGAVRSSTAGSCVWDSLARSTWGSLLRQVGGHDAAAVFDGRALAAVAPARGAGEVPVGAVASDAGAGAVWFAAARSDALTGLAADRLGRGDWRSARRLLSRFPYRPRYPGESVHPAVAGSAPSGSTAPACARILLRWYWVRAETAMTAGDADAALAAARRARDLVDSGVLDSERHRVKTLLVHAAADAVAGRDGPARRLADDARRRAGASGLDPLCWAACMLLAGVAFGTRVGDAAAAEQRRLAQRIGSRGGELRQMRRYL